MGDAGTWRFCVRGEAAGGRDDEFRRVRALRRAIMGTVLAGFCVICSFFFFLPHVLTAFSLGAVHSLPNKSLSHTNMTDDAFSSFGIHLVIDVSVGPTLPFASDIKISHQYFTTIRIALLGQLTFPKGLIPVSFEEKNKMPCNQRPHPCKRNRDISSETGPRARVLRQHLRLNDLHLQNQGGGGGGELGKRRRSVNH